MIRRVDQEYIKTMTGCDLTVDGNTIYISSGTIDGKPLEEVEFDLVFDTETQKKVKIDLYIVINDHDEYEYRLYVTYLDDYTFSIYDGPERLFHNVLTIITYPDGSYEGEYRYLVPIKNLQDPGRKDDHRDASFSSKNH